MEFKFLFIIENLFLCRQKEDYEKMIEKLIFDYEVIYYLNFFLGWNQIIQRIVLRRSRVFVLDSFRIFLRADKISQIKWIIRKRFEAFLV